MAEVMEMYGPDLARSLPNCSHNQGRKERFGLTFGQTFVCRDDTIPPSQQIFILTVFKMEQMVLLYDIRPSSMSRSSALKVA